jgi:hypothetical protein
MQSLVTRFWPLVLILSWTSAGYCLEGGYASLNSAPQGGVIDLHISTATPTYTILIYREGPSRLLMKRITGLHGVERNCPEPGYETGCGWPVAYSLEVPASWASGVYTAQFNTGPNGTSSKLIIFVVREETPGSTAPILFSVASNTHSAYNEVGGKSLYDYNSSNLVPATTVSYDRPYRQGGDGKYYEREHPFVMWAESMGYPVEYATDVDIHADPGLLFHYRCFVIAGHAEYWTREMRENLDAFVKAGGNALILAGNTCWWQVRLSPDLRRITGYKDSAFTRDPFAIDADPSNDHLITTHWFRLPVPEPENSTTGLSWRDGGYHNYKSAFLVANGFGGYRVYRTDHWAFQGTGLADGDMIGREAAIVGYEVDGTLLEARAASGSPAWDAQGFYPLSGALPYVTNTKVSRTPENFVVLGLAPSTKGHAVMGLFESSAGGHVFNAGTTNWVMGLESDPLVARITENLLDFFSGLAPRTNLRPAARIEGSFPVGSFTGSEVHLRGRGFDPDGCIEAYSWRSSLDGFLSDEASFSTSTLSLGSHRIFFRVRDDGGAWSSEEERDIGVMPAGPDQAIVMDNGDPGTSFSGVWQRSTAGEPFGDLSLFAKDSGATYSYRLQVPEAGAYRVFAWWTQLPTRVTSVPVEVAALSGKETVFVDQTKGGGQWNLLGTFDFSSAAVVTIRSVGPGSTSADAISLLPLGQNLAPKVFIDHVPGSASADQTVFFQGHGDDPDGFVTFYSWRSSLDGFLSDRPDFSAAGLSPGVHTIFFRVQDDLGLWSGEARARLDVLVPVEPGAIVLDAGKPGTSSFGSWSVSAGQNPFGATSLWSKQPGATYTYRLDVPERGEYKVYAWWTTYVSRVSVVPVEIAHGCGKATVLVDQQEDGGRWNLLGTWTFDDKATVTVRSLGPGSTCADGVMLVPAGGNK